MAARYRKYASVKGTKQADIAFDKMIADIEKHRGKAAAERLRTDALKALKG